MSQGKDVEEAGDDCVVGNVGGDVVVILFLQNQFYISTNTTAAPRLVAYRTLLTACVFVGEYTMKPIWC